MRASDDVIEHNTSCCVVPTTFSQQLAVIIVDHERFGGESGVSAVIRLKSVNEEDIEFAVLACSYPAFFDVAGLRKSCVKAFHAIPEDSVDRVIEQCENLTKTIEEDKIMFEDEISEELHGLAELGSTERNRKTELIRMVNKFDDIAFDNHCGRYCDVRTACVEALPTLKDVM